MENFWVTPSRPHPSIPCRFAFFRTFLVYNSSVSCAICVFYRHLRQKPNLGGMASFLAAMFGPGPASSNPCWPHLAPCYSVRVMQFRTFSRHFLSICLYLLVFASSVSILVEIRNLGGMAAFPAAISGPKLTCSRPCRPFLATSWAILGPSWLDLDPS